MTERFQGQKLIGLSEQASGRFERPSARETRQRAKQGLLIFGELVVAPLYRRAECLMSRQHTATRSSKMAEPVIEARADVFDRKQLCSSRRKLDGERYPIETAADLDDRGRVLTRKRESTRREFRTIGEQADCFEIVQL